MSNYEEQLAAMQGHGDKQMPGEQGSPEWLAERCGCCTASRFKDAIDTLKNGKSSAKRENYLMELVIERLTGISAEHFVNDAMLHGTETEPLARMAYEQHTGAMVLVPGFVRHPTIKMCGGSADGLVDADGITEFKCPNSGTHIKTLLAEDCEHLPQIQGLLWITGRQWCDFVSYDNRLPNGLELYVQRIMRDDDYIAELAAGVLNFLAEVDAMLKPLLAMIVPPAGDARPVGFRGVDIPPLEP